MKVQEPWNKKINILHLRHRLRSHIWYLAPGCFLPTPGGGVEPSLKKQPVWHKEKCCPPLPCGNYIPPELNKCPSTKLPCLEVIAAALYVPQHKYPCSEIHIVGEGVSQQEEMNVDQTSFILFYRPRSSAPLT